MPRVPTLDGQRVRQRAVPNPRVNFGDVAAGELRETTQQFGQATQGFDRIAQQSAELGLKYKRQADSRRATDGTVSASDESSALENQLLGFKGKDSFESLQKFNEGFSEIRERHAGELSNDSQREQFSRNIDEAYRKSIGRLERHTASERTKYADNQTKSLLNNSQNIDLKQSINDTDINDAVSFQRDVILKDADEKGQSNAEIQERINESTSNTYSNSILQIINAKNPSLAKQQLGKFKKFIDPKKVKSLQGMIKEGTEISEVGFLSDSIISKSDDFLEAIQLADRRISNPERRQKVKKRLKFHFDTEKSAIKQRDDSQFDDFSKKLDELPLEQRGAGIEDHLSVGEISNLTPKRREALEKILHPPRETNEKKYTKFWQLSDNEVSEMSVADLQEKYISHMSKSDRKKATDRIGTVTRKIKDGKNFQPSTSFRLEDQIVDSMIRFEYANEGSKKNGFNSQQSKVFRLVKEQSESLIETAEQEKGKKLTGTEKRKLLEGLLVKNKTRDDSGDSFFKRNSFFFNRNNEKVSEIDLLIDGKSKAKSGFDQIPRLEAARIIKKFKNRGINNPTKSQIESEYLKGQR